MSTIESETFKVTQQAKGVVNIIMTKFQNVMNQAGQSDLAKKAGTFSIHLCCAFIN